VVVPIADGVASVGLVSTAANTPAAPHYGVTAGVRSGPEDTTVETVGVVKDATTGQEIAGRNGVAQIVFRPDQVDAGNSILTIPTAGDTKYVGGTDKHTAQVQVRDAQGSPVPGVAVRFDWIVGTVEGPGSGDWTTVNAPNSDAYGQTSFEFAAPQNQAVWVWVRAWLIDGLTLEAVGAQVGPPVVEQTVVGAEFDAIIPDPTNTRASFRTYEHSVRNDLVAQSSAWVVVQDQYGNGIGGATVTFQLPTDAERPAGTLGTPVFVDGNTPPTSKTITVTTCARNLAAADVPETCKIDGVYTPGLAYIPIVSDYEGDFTVSGAYSLGAVSGAAGSGTVKFHAPVGEPDKSSFTVVKTDPTAAKVLADGVGSYTVTASVRGDGGAKPASGVCVVPNWPAASLVQIKPPLPAAGDCGAGAYVTGVDGTVSFEIVTTLAGSWPISFTLDGVSIPTEPDGDVYTRQAVFYGGAQSAVHRVLIRPPTPARADDPAGQTVRAVIRDVNGNQASCWDVNGQQQTCEVSFYYPAGTRSGSTVGPAAVKLMAGLADPSVPVPAIGEIAATLTLLGEQGTYPVRAMLGEQWITRADGVESTSGPAEARVTFTDATPPSPPVVNPSDGGHVDGKVPDDDLDDAADGDLTVVVTDEDGNTVATCPVKPDGTFDCPIVPAVPDGTDLVVVIVDGGENASDPIEIVTDGVAPGEPVVNPSDGDHVDGKVADEDLDDAAGGDLTVVVTDQDGTVVATCPVRADGTFDCPIVPSVPDGTDLTVVIEDPAHNATHPPVEIVTDGVPPTRPTVDESDGEHVTGQVGDQDRGDAADGNLQVVVTDGDGDVVATCPVRPDGTFDCPIEPGLEDGETIRVVVVDPAGNESTPVNKVVDGVPPGAPTIDESNGTSVTGQVADQDKSDAAHGDLTVVITGEDGNVITTCPVKPDGSFNCPINPRLPHGEEATVAIVDKAGNSNDSQIVVDGVAPGTPVLEPSRGDEVTGVIPDDDLADAAGGALSVIVTDPSTGEELCRAAVQADGTWSCVFDPAIPDGTVVEVTLVDKAGNVSDKMGLTVDATAPILPVPEPSAGGIISGIGEEQGNKITVTDVDGNVLCETTVGADRSWSCELAPAASVGDILTVSEQDLSRNIVNRPWRVGIPELTVAKPTLCLGDRQAATGLNFQPGETVTAVTSGEVAVGSIKANSEGMVVFQWVIPENTPRSVHTLTVRGPLSGVHTIDFSVTCGGPPADIVPVAPKKLPFTGADGVLGMTGAALGMLLAGFLLLLAAKRRRRQEADRA
jgi:hypothetical protein